MTLDQEFAKYQGQSLLVPGDTEADRGQCVQWVDYVLHDVYGLPYHYGNAIDWWNNPGELLNHFNKITDSSIKKGDIVVFNTKVGSQFGHIDVALSDGTTQDFYGTDSNWNGNLTVHEVHHVGSQYVLGSLRFKGGDVAIPTIDVGGVNTLFYAYLGRPPEAQDAANIGRPWQDVVYDLAVSQEHKNYLAKIQKALGDEANLSGAQAEIDKIKAILNG